MTLSHKPRLLFIAPVMPDEAGNGLAMRQGQFLAAYAPHFTIDLAVIPLAGPADAATRFASRHVARLRIFPATALDTQFALLRRLKDPAARLAAFTTYGRPSIQARLTANIQGDLAGWIAGQNHHLIHVGRLYLLGLASVAPCIVDADEDDARLLTQLAAQSVNAHEAAWLRAEAAHAARHASKHLPAMRHIFAANIADAQTLGSHGPPVTMIPNLVPRTRRLPRRPGKNLLFVGTLGYRPNAAGVAWFLKHCWPRLRQSMPGAKLDIVGGGGAKKRTQNGAVRHGWVRDLAPFYAQAAAVIVPVRAGGGSRIKLLEAAAHACPIIATSIGAEGTHLRAGRDFLRADDPARFAKAVRSACAAPWIAPRIAPRMPRLGIAARRAVLRHHHPASWRKRIAAIALAQLA